MTNLSETQVRLRKLDLQVALHNDLKNEHICGSVLFVQRFAAAHQNSVSSAESQSWFPRTEVLTHWL